MLGAIHAMPDHEFWEAGFSYRAVAHTGVASAGEVTDACLAELARRRGGKLATMDAALAADHADVAVLLPS